MQMLGAKGGPGMNAGPSKPFPSHTSDDMGGGASYEDDIPF